MTEGYRFKLPKGSFIVVFESSYRLDQDLYTFVVPKPNESDNSMVQRAKHNLIIQIAKRYARINCYKYVNFWINDMQHEYVKLGQML